MLAVLRTGLASVGAALALTGPGPGRPAARLALGGLLLVPGRLQALLLRDHFLSRRDHRRHDAAQAHRHDQAQLQALGVRPWTR